MTQPSDKLSDLPGAVLPTIAELPGDLQLLAETMLPVIGDEVLTVRVVLVVSEKLRGSKLYISGIDAEGKRKARNQQIRAEYDRGGITGPQLARKYRLGDRQIWNILGRADE